MTRKVFKIEGKDREHFLQGLVTNDLAGLSEGLVYAAFLTPQGKYLADFFLKDAGDAILLDADADQAPTLLQRLTLYKLRADVTIGDSGLSVLRGTGPAPEGALSDPRHPGLGWRAYVAGEEGDDGTDFDRIRVEQCIPAAGIELIPNETFILEAGFERLNGVDFRKGCYVGQEVTSRMKHKTSLRKGFATVAVDGAAALGTPIETADGKAAGTLYTQSGGKGIAYLRFDRAAGVMRAAEASISLAAEAASS